MFGDPQINFYVQDVDASTRFYRESFGFTETFRTLRAAWVADPDGNPVQIVTRRTAPAP